MQRAEGDLRGSKPGRAHSEEREAEGKLGELRKQLQQQRRPGQQGAQGQNVATERIRIPGADEFRAPKEFREQILEEEKEVGRAPESYRGQLKRFYEELVK
jgi:hypothetical protein